MKGTKDHKAAAREAFEEPAWVGRSTSDRWGHAYDKRTGNEGESVEVMFYLHEVSEEKQTWPEEDQRRQEWMNPVEASALVAEPELADILLRGGSTPEDRAFANA